MCSITPEADKSHSDTGRTMDCTELSLRLIRQHFAEEVVDPPLTAKS